MNDQTLRVLVVDADANSREPLAAFLRQHGPHVVDTAADASQALEGVKQSAKPYHVALIDEVLMSHTSETPQRLGVELMQQIRDVSPQTEVILFRGEEREPALDAALRSGAFRYLPKSFDRDELAILVRRAADYQRVRDAARDNEIFERLMDIGSALFDGQHQPEVLDTILTAVQAIGFDRVRL